MVSKMMTLPPYLSPKKSHQAQWQFMGGGGEGRGGSESQLGVFTVCFPRRSHGNLEAIHNLLFSRGLHLA